MTTAQYTTAASSDTVEEWLWEIADGPGEDNPFHEQWDLIQDHDS